MRVRQLDGEGRFAVISILAGVALAALWAWVVPYGQTPDEPEHFDLVRFIAVHGRFAVFDAEPDIIQTSCAGPAGPCRTSYTMRPGFAYAIAAGAMRAGHFLTGRPIPDLYYAARLASAAALAIFGLFLWRTAQLLLADRPWARVTALVVGMFIPQVSFLGGCVNIDAYALAVGASVVYIAACVSRDGLTPGRAAAAGVALGLLLLSRFDHMTLSLLFTVAWLAAGVAAARGGRLRRFAASTGLVLILTVLVGGWWYARNAILYGHPLGTPTVRAKIAQLAPEIEWFARSDRLSVAQLLFDYADWPLWTYCSFWGVFGWMGIWWHRYVYAALFVPQALAALGLALAAARAVLSDGARALAGDGRGLLAGAVFFVSIVLLSAWNSSYYEYQPQGRYLYAALVPFLILLGRGLDEWGGAATIARLRTLAVAATVIGLNAYSLTFILIPLYEPAGSAVLTAAAIVVTAAPLAAIAGLRVRPA